MVEYYREAYNIFDADHNGSIDVYELGNVMRSCGMDPTEDEVKQMISGVDVDGTGTIDFDEFLMLFTLNLIKKMEDFRGETRLRYTAEKLDEAFKAMDLDGNGFISAADLINVVKRHGEDLLGEEALDMIREADADGDGVVNFSDFCELVTGWQTS
ncbi:hypothetical protein HK100_012124 [Physocladia obscura]|uniref:EF-hand domain-containing protein n=1 Tax=Physocladia obscura TaxID=109957 RepID=A0AAD5T355_9FUNG|nr:hypothetical protein HK100_012124 [Physocladia obscura]